MTHRMWTRDNLRIRVPVRDDEGAAVPLTGATVTAVVALGDTAIALTTAITDAPAGLVELSAPAGALAVGRWALQAWVQIGGDLQTVVDTHVDVLKSLPTPT